MLERHDSQVCVWYFTPADAVILHSVQREDGRWTGIIGELVADNGTDFTVVLTMLYNRVNAIRFTRIYAIDTFVFVTGLAKPIPQWLSIFRPFKSESILGVVGSH